MLGVLKARDYRLLWIGQAVSHLGDQFHLIALPWLVLTLTHDPFQLGLVLALAGIPRAAVMLIGGAFADRHSPRVIMLVSDALRFVIAAALAVSILTGSVQLWMVYALAVGFGVVSGFFMPAAEASLPRLLENKQLEAGNALMMGADQLMSFVGPALAGVVIALFGASHVAGATAGSLTGVGVAFAVDALSFAVSAAMLALMHALPALAAGDGDHPLAAVAAGLRFTVAAPGLPLDARPDRRREPAAHRAADGRHPGPGSDAVHPGRRGVRHAHGGVRPRQPGRDDRRGHAAAGRPPARSRRSSWSSSSASVW